MQRKTWYSILGLDAKPLSTKFGMLRKKAKSERTHQEFQKDPKELQKIFEKNSNRGKEFQPA